MKSKEFLDTKVIEKKEFSIHSLINKDQLTKEEAKKVVDLAKVDSRISIYYFLLCPACKAKMEEGLFREDLVGRDKKCNACDKKFIAQDKTFQLVFDPRTLKEKYNS